LSERASLHAVGIEVLRREPCLEPMPVVCRSGAPNQMWPISIVPNCGVIRR
jgi:hypothetical protein